MDRTSRRKTASFFLGAFGMDLAASTALTAAIGFFWPAWFGLAGDEHSPEELGRGTVAVNFGWSTGGAIGAVIAGILFEIGPIWPFIAAAFAALLVLPVYLMRPPLGKVGTGATFPKIPKSGACPHFPPVVSERPHPSIREESASIVGQTQMWRLWLGNLSVFSMIGLLVCVFPALGDEIGVKAGLFGAFVFLLGAMRSGGDAVALYGSQRT